MNRFLRSLSLFAGLASFQAIVFAQGVGPQLTISPGVLATVASRTNNVLSGNPDGNLQGITASFNGVAFRNTSNGPTIYLSNAPAHQVFQVVLNTGQVTAVAGNGTAGYSGDGGPATSAQLNEPAGLAFDSNGNLYIVDTTQNVVRRVDTAGNITTFAGTGQTGVQPFGGDGGPATSAQLSQPVSIAFDATNNAYIADSGHSRIRQVNTSGTINTVAGNGIAQYSGDGPATSVSLNVPAGVAVDSSGNLYITDTRNHLVRRVTGGNLSTVAGSVVATPNVGGYSGDGGPATSARLNVPYGIAVDAGGAFYIADAQNNRLRRVGTDGVITTIAGNGAAGLQGDGGNAASASLNAPNFLTIDRSSGNLYFVDFGNVAIRSVSAAAAPVTFPLIAPGATATATITLTNSGDQTLNVTSSNFPSGFSFAAGGSCTNTTPSIGPGRSCTMNIQFAATSGGPTQGTLTISSDSATGAANVLLTESNGLRFIPITPCRVADTRVSGGAFGTNEQRDYDIVNGPWVNCTTPIPAGTNVLAYSLNVTVVPKGQLLYVTAFPTGISVPNVSTLNSFDGRIKANAAIVPAGTGSNAGKVSIFARNPTDVVVDLNGYFVPASDPSAPLAFYPVPPCRAVDTRRTNGPFGGPFISAKATGRQFAMAQSTCGVPGTARAVSVNVTAVPKDRSLTYLTLWPADKDQPFVSTLNSPTGTVVANAAIVPATSDGNATISAYATDNIDLIVDVNGYYAPFQSGGLSLYNITPCRAFDTRGPALTDPLKLNGVSVQDIAGHSDPNHSNDCNVPRVAQSYVLNATVIPTSSLIYMTNWAHGTAQPLQSTLNAYDASITSNLAIVPTLDGMISSYTTAPTGLIFDIFGYFAP